MDILQSTEHFFMNVLPVATPIIVAWLGYKMPKKTKEQTDQIISELNDVKKQIKHDDAHLVTMRMRLDRDIRRAIRRGFTTKDEFYVVENMHNSYKALGGNGYIDHLYNNFEALQIRDDILVEDEKGKIYDTI